MSASIQRGPGGGTGILTHPLLICIYNYYNGCVLSIWPELALNYTQMPVQIPTFMTRYWKNPIHQKMSNEILLLVQFKRTRVT